jgi:type IV pilus assembly protein PilB
MARNKSISEILLEMGAIDEMQHQVANTHAQQWGMSFEQAVVERRFCSLDDVVRAFSLQTGYPVINLDAEVLDLTRADLLPLKVAEQYRVVPLGLQGKRYEVIVLAVAVPATPQTIDAVLAVTKKARAVVHVSHADAVDRAIARLYRKGGVAPPPPPPVERKVEVQNEQLFELPEEAHAPLAPVLLYGWHPAAGKAMAMMLEQGGLRVQPLDDAGLERVQPHEVMMSTTLALRSALGSDGRLKCRLIICGTQEPGDAEDARALGAKLYLRPPHSTEQLKKAVLHVTRPK